MGRTLLRSLHNKLLDAMTKLLLTLFLLCSCSLTKPVTFIGCEEKSCEALLKQVDLGFTSMDTSNTEKVFLLEGEKPGFIAQEGNSFRMGLKQRTCGYSFERECTKRGVCNFYIDTRVWCTLD
jgi:hypothetical protein